MIEPDTDVLDLGSWFILRMASADTLKVSNELSRRGFTVWTPIEHKTGRMPRTKARYDRQAAIMPSYLFAHVEHLEDVLRLAVSFDRDCPNFSVFHHKGGIPLIADSELASLRHEEGRLMTIYNRLRNRGRKAPEFPKGSMVHMTEGAFAGLSGVVEGTQGQHTLVSFTGFHKPIKIASLLLLSEVVSAELHDAA